MSKQKSQASGRTAVALLIAIALLIACAAGALVWINRGREPVAPAVAPETASPAPEESASSVIAAASPAPIETPDAAGTLAPESTGISADEVALRAADGDYSIAETAAVRIGEITGAAVTAEMVDSEIASYESLTGEQLSYPEYVAFVEELFLYGTDVGDGDADAWDALPEDVPVFADFVSCAAVQVTQENQTFTGGEIGTYIATVVARSEAVNDWISTFSVFGWTEGEGGGVWTNGAYTLSIARVDNMDGTESVTLLVAPV